jgi:hypothetical protein
MSEDIRKELKINNTTVKWHTTQSNDGNTFNGWNESLSHTELPSKTKNGRDIFEELRKAGLTKCDTNGYRKELRA